MFLQGEGQDKQQDVECSIEIRYKDVRHHGLLQLGGRNLTCGEEELPRDRIYRFQGIVLKLGIKLFRLSLSLALLQFNVASSTRSPHEVFKGEAISQPSSK